MMFRRSDLQLACQKVMLAHVCTHTQTPHTAEEGGFRAVFIYQIFTHRMGRSVYILINMFIRSQFRCCQDAIASHFGCN